MQANLHFAHLLVGAKRVWKIRIKPRILLNERTTKGLKASETKKMTH